MSVATQEPLKPDSFQPPQRSSASKVLWAHLLRKDSPSSLSSQSPSIHPPPITALDKSATSTRILLHDTQANLEKFCERVDKLTLGVGDAQKELVKMGELFGEDREKLLGDVVELVNRSQTEVQKTVGSPAQSTSLSDLIARVDMSSLKIDALDKRMDALQSLTASQSQTIHTQSASLHSLASQQSQILTALLPLLPLVQALPLQIDEKMRALSVELNAATYTESRSELKSNDSRKRKRSRVGRENDDRRSSFARSQSVNCADGLAPPSISASNSTLSDAYGTVKNADKLVPFSPIRNSWSNRTLSSQKYPDHQSVSRNSHQNQKSSLLTSSPRDTRTQTHTNTLRRPLADLELVPDPSASRANTPAGSGPRREHTDVSFTDIPGPQLVLTPSSTHHHKHTRLPASLGRKHSQIIDRSDANLNASLDSCSVSGAVSGPSMSSSGSLTIVAAADSSVVTIPIEATTVIASPVETATSLAPPPLSKTLSALVPPPVDQEMTHDSGTDLLPVIRPMNMQRSWTMAGNNGKRFIPLVDDDEDDEEGNPFE